MGFGFKIYLVFTDLVIAHVAFRSFRKYALKLLWFSSQEIAAQIQKYDNRQFLG